MSTKPPVTHVPQSAAAQTSTASSVASLTATAPTLTEIPKVQNHSSILTKMGGGEKVELPSSSESSSASESENDSLKQECVKQKKTVDQAYETSDTKSRTRTPPCKYVDDFGGMTPKTTPTGQKSPKRLSTSINRMTKSPLRKKVVKLAKDTPSPYRIGRRSRGKACGKCEQCTRSDCGKCPHCLDKVKFGGPGKRKQRCSLRNCDNMVSQRMPKTSAVIFVAKKVRVNVKCVIRLMSSNKLYYSYHFVKCLGWLTLCILLSHTP